MRISLSSFGYSTIEATTAQEGQALIVSNTVSLILLDLGLPDIDGLLIIQWLREFSKTPIIVLSARSSPDDKITALDAGANDYLVKPFTIPDLKARIDAVFRNPTELTPPGVLRTGHLKIDINHKTVEVAGTQASLSELEFKILRLLIDKADQIVTHNRILKEVWGAISNEHRHHLRTAIAGLRQKIEQKPSRPVYLQSESGVGYRFRILPPLESEP